MRQRRHRDRTAAGTGAAGGEWYCRSRWEKIICGITETAGTSGNLWSGTCGTAGDPSGRKVGFTVTVLEDRVSFAGEALRAGADQVICDSFENALKQIPGSEDTYFLIVTRGHRYDRVCLEAILKKPYAYVGMMASRGRSALLKKQMEEDGFDRKVLDEIHTPVGLDIHAETPEEIAVSIVSELIKEKNSVRKTSGYDAELLDYLTGEKEPDTKKALATIVARRGSAPRGIGTKMLVLEDGRIIGTIGGGCMESEVQHLCLRMLHEERAQGRSLQ